MAYRQTLPGIVLKGHPPPASFFHAPQIETGRKQKGREEFI